MRLLIGNIVALIGSIIMIMVGLIKSKKKILIVQTIQVAFFMVSNFILEGFSGVIINGSNIVRNILCYKDKFTTKIKVILGIVITITTIYFNNKGIIGYFPLISALACLIFYGEKNVMKYKLWLGLTTILWLVYDAYIQSYTAAIFDLSFIISNFIGMYRVHIDNKKKEKDCG